MENESAGGLSVLLLFGGMILLPYFAYKLGGWKSFGINVMWFFLGLLPMGIVLEMFDLDMDISEHQSISCLALISCQVVHVILLLRGNVSTGPAAPAEATETTVGVDKWLKFFLFPTRAEWKDLWNRKSDPKESLPEEPVKTVSEKGTEIADDVVEQIPHENSAEPVVSSANESGSTKRNIVPEGSAIEKRLLAKMEFLKIKKGSKDYEQFKERFETNLPKWKKAKISAVSMVLIFMPIVGFGVSSIALLFDSSGLLHTIFMLIGITIAGISFIVGIVWIFQGLESFRDKLSNGGRCVWCGIKGLTFLSGESSPYSWVFKDSKGGKDKRVKDNFRQASYLSNFQCDDCSAESRFRHNMDKDPSKDDRVWKGELLKDGWGRRAKKDFTQLGNRLLAKMKLLGIKEGSKDFEQLKERFDANLSAQKLDNGSCIWCDCEELSYLGGQEGSWVWHYRNKDGSRDRRRQGNNWQEASFISDFSCNECCAETKFTHAVSQKPSLDQRVMTRRLSKNGLGTRMKG